ncbi:hypothetical protein KQX54_001752 [Cotesia glomerata]|uniref:Uncharacterized protein n=1 Tax=Cotesia glomerata TaxID=32391 RepID=A0AAV7IIQ1_COTGL|nr:hypothetical protein KQX54_001752 [Cotesia glomerata]
MTELFALAKWITKEEAGTYTVGVPTDWIKNFSYEEFKKDSYDPDMTYVIEWRKGKKSPAGWPVYDGLVTEVSSSIIALEKKFNSYYQGVQSSNITISSIDEDVSGETQQSSKPITVASSSAETQSTENSFSAKILAEMKNMKQEMTRIRSKRKNSDSEESNSETENNPEQIEIGRRGSGIKVTDQQWRCATSQSTCTGMATSLLIAVLPMETLLKSNSKGGKSRINKDSNNAVQLQQIDPVILEAIKCKTK